jgi:class 3 adenylate cyclase
MKRTGFARLGASRIAFEVSGTGPVDLLHVLGSFVSFDTAAEDAMAEVYYRRLASFSRLIRFDRRGAGSSDAARVDASPVDAYVEETLAVMDAVGTKRAAVMAGYDAGPMAVSLAVAHPNRVTALILSNTTARYLEADDYPIGLDLDEAEHMIAMVSDTWGTEEQVSRLIPSRADDPLFRARLARLQRLTLSPAEAARYMRALAAVDVRPLLTSIDVPTLVLHRSDLRLIPMAHAQYLADHIGGARLVTIPGKDGPFVWEHPELALDAIEEFLTGIAPQSGSDRAMATILFTDIVGSTRLAEELGDRRWRTLIDVHDEIAARVVAAHEGRLDKLTGDGFMATFDRPGKAILAATEFGRQTAGLGVAVRAGIHTGEVELRGDTAGGLAVHLASRIMGQAGPGEVLASRTVKELVVGADLVFEDRGPYRLKGFEDEWQLFSVASPPEG